MSKIVTVHRKAHFNAAHQLTNSQWNESKNEDVFGKCSNPYFHGHNYELIVSITGPVNKETGFVFNLSELKVIIKEDIEEYLDHKNLNVQVKEFMPSENGLIPTAENICIVIWERLKNRLPEHLKLSVRLFETPRNFVDYCGEDC